MRKIFTLFTLAMLFGASAVFAGSGGPDAFGYTWKDSNEPSGPVYSWIDITSMGTQVTGLADDNAAGPVNIGFDFRYYWSDYNQVKIGSNGWLSFKTSVGNIASPFPTIPSPGGNADDFLAPLLSDLSFSTSGAANVGEVYYWTNNVDSFIVSYVNVPWWTNLNPNAWQGSNTFQVILSGVDSSITFQYQTSDAANFENRASYQDLIIGIENTTGNIGLELYNDETGTAPFNTVPASASAIKFYYPQTIGITIPDATPFWTGNVDDAGQFIVTNQNYDLETNIKNVGNGDITNSITVDGELRSLAQASIWTGTDNIASLTAGSDQTITFTPTLNLTTAGQYYYEVNVTNSQDINPSNNDAIIEISAVEKDAQNKIRLSYATQNPPDGITGFGPGDGLGIKIVPPGYPVDVESVEFFLLHDTTAAYDDVEVLIYDDSGPAGTGTLLAQQTLTGSSQVDNDWNAITLTSPITVNSGAIYVAFVVQGAGNTFLGSEDFGPISRRTYEVIAGSWATSRSNTTTELLINVNIDATNMVTVGKEDDLFADASFITYPNPAADVANIRFEMLRAGNASFVISNIHGQQVFTKTFENAAGEIEFSVNTADLQSGIYMITMESNGKTATRKLIIR